MTIERIATTPIRAPLGRIYQGSHYRMTHRSTVVVRVETSTGVVGEAYAGDEDDTLLAIDQIIRDEITPVVIGEDAFAIERIWERARPATWNILRDRRLGIVACAAVDAALWDAIGKALGQPLWRLWGGYRNSIPVISIGGYYAADADVRSEVEEVRSRGLAGMKFKVGGLSPEADAVRFHEARAAGGDCFALAADANQGWTTDEAIAFARLVDDANLLWFEEPCRWDNDRRGMRDVRLKAAVPTCAGQSEHSAAGCRDLMTDGSIDYCNFDSSWSGGPTEWRRAAAIASTYEVKMAHHEEPHVAAHLLCSIPHGSFLEVFHPDRDPFWWNLISNRPRIDDGVIELSDRPGFGWELDQDYIDHHRVGDG
jgi:D-galactarolactone cycloisomerase